MIVDRHLLVWYEILVRPTAIMGDEAYYVNPTTAVVNGICRILY
jgi:hypothetical protein